MSMDLSRTRSASDCVMDDESETTNGTLGIEPLLKCLDSRRKWSDEDLQYLTPEEISEIEKAESMDTESDGQSFLTYTTKAVKARSIRETKQMVTLNVGGQLFTTTIATLTRFPDTMLGVMFSCQHALTQDTNGSYFIDRDGRHFHEILNFLRGSTACTPVLLEQRLSSGALEELKVEADYYGVKDLMFPEPMSCKSWNAEPVVIKSRAGWDSIVTQGDDKLWYVEHPRIGTPRLVTVCDHCGVGYISHKIFWDSYMSFTNGRTIMKNQPRPCGTCPRCNDW